MSDKERYGERDLTYSWWHRTASIGRFLPSFEAWRCGMVDIDDVEYCRWCYEPLALIELAQDVGQTYKPAAVTENLAIRAEIPAYLCFYTVSESDITRFRVTSLTDGEYVDKILTPSEYAWFLSSFHESHDCPKKKK